MYALNPWWCGHFDEENFRAEEMCCACGGGNRDSENDGGKDGVNDDDNVIPD